MPLNTANSSDLHCEAICSSELKPSVLALIDEEMPIFMIPNPRRHLRQIDERLVQVIARGSCPIISCNPGAFEPSGKCEEVEILRTVDCLQGLLDVVQLQLMRYCLTVAEGLDVDWPGDLVKAVRFK